MATVWRMRGKVAGVGMSIYGKLCYICTEIKVNVKAYWGSVVIVPRINLGTR